MRALFRTVGLLGLLATNAGCSRQSTTAAAPGAANHGVITRSEMEKSRYASLFEVVQALRGGWLQPRGPTSFLSRPSEVQVVVDDMRMGGVEALRTLSTYNVVSIVYVDPVAAAQRWGGKHVQGTILVTTKADGVP